MNSLAQSERFVLILIFQQPLSIHHLTCMDRQHAFCRIQVNSFRIKRLVRLRIDHTIAGAAAELPMRAEISQWQHVVKGYSWALCGSQSCFTSLVKAGTKRQNQPRTPAHVQLCTPMCISPGRRRYAMFTRPLASDLGIAMPLTEDITMFEERMLVDWKTLKKLAGPYSDAHVRMITRGPFPGSTKVRQHPVLGSRGAGRKSTTSLTAPIQPSPPNTGVTAVMGREARHPNQPLFISRPRPLREIEGEIVRENVSLTRER